MGNKCPKCECKSGDETALVNAHSTGINANESGGFHIFEIHLPTAAVGSGAIVAAIIVVMLSVWAYRSYRKRRERHFQARYFKRAHGEGARISFMGRHRLPCIGGKLLLPAPGDQQQQQHDCRRCSYGRRTGYDSDRFTDLGRSNSPAVPEAEAAKGSKGYYGDDLP